MKNKTLFTIFGVVCLFCIRLCTQTSEATSTVDLDAQERALIGTPHDVPACFLIPTEHGTRNTNTRPQ